MILQRIGSAVRNQDWFVVSIEILIVILGVFIGLQVDDWNNERKDRVQERHILQRLLTEAEDAVVHISRFVEDRAGRNRELEKMVAFVADPEQFPMDENEAAVTLPRLTHYPSLKPSRTVLDELTTSGQLQLIHSQEVRNALGRYASSLSFHDGQLDAFRSVSDKVLEVSLPYLEGRYTPEGQSIRTILVDWPSLRADQSVFFILLSAMRNQYTFQTYREGLLEDAQLMCDVLAGELEQKCQPDFATD